jgi:hypothetical protein
VAFIDDATMAKFPNKTAIKEKKAVSTFQSFTPLQFCRGPPSLSGNIAFVIKSAFRVIKPWKF